MKKQRPMILKAPLTREVARVKASTLLARRLPVLSIERLEILPDKELSALFNQHGSYLGSRQ